MRAFVTGGHGFVGRWLVAHLAGAGDDIVAPHQRDADVTDAAEIADVVATAEPDVVYHLAGLAHVGDSWGDPQSVFRINVGGTLNVLEAARGCRRPPRVVIVSSAEVYGTVTPEQLPLGESAPMLPVSPYAASKAASELMAIQEHLGWHVPTIRVRPFNHAGPGQSPTFVVPALARRIVEAVRTGATVLRVGNLSPRRDITDVRDVVRAYRLLASHGAPGAVYNICSGRDVGIEQLVRRMLELAGAELALEVDAELMRPADVPVLRGDPSALRAATGWEPEVPLDQTLADVLAEAEAEATATAPAP